MFGLFAVARHTFRQCLRMKVAALFIILLAAALMAMPFLKILKGDGTLSGQIKTFLIYGTALTAAMLSLMTIFLTTGIVSDDIRKKLIFNVATKPVARWQYILGRWLGVVVLNAILISVAGAGMYLLCQYLRGGQALESTSGRAEDRRRIETEIFAARQRLLPDELVDVVRAVDTRVEDLKSSNRYKEVMDAYSAKYQGDQKLAYEALRRELKKQVLDAIQSAGPGRSLTWRFSGIHVGGAETRGRGQVAKIAREARALSVQADWSLIGQLTYRGPVRINGVDGWVDRIRSGAFDVRFSEEEMSTGAIISLREGDQVEIVADPTIQITYKASAASRPHDNILASYWEVQNPTTGLLFSQRRNDAVGVRSTLTISARVVDDLGRTVIRYFNIPKPSTGFVTSVTIRHDDVAVLYRVGDFGPNFIRGMALIFIELSFLAALGVLAGSFVSFPVACLLCFSMLPFQIARTFVMDAVTSPVSQKGIPPLISALNKYLVIAMNKLLPDFGRTFPGQALVDGMHIEWGFLGQTVLWTFCVQTAVLLVIACVIFSRRELARVQV